uniref:Carnitine acetyl transferase n=1 Tax=Ganoderma boninense TaxID=34458 RepID=A0A5K1K598_9APHY|nr:Carnitine acetyl transferase [Ganoderma boninense]
MKLTYDVLLHIISLSWFAQDSLQLIATCRILYHEGPKIALKKPVIISTAEQLTSFLIFLHADNSSRCRYLRQLDLTEFFLHYDVIQELIETMPLLTSVESLRLAEAEQLVDIHPAFTTTFGTLTTLRHIDFTGVTQRTCGLLRGLHAPLISARLDFLSNVEQMFWDSLENDALERYHPTMLLENFAPTLKVLVCASWYINPASDLAVMPTKVYPNMRKLSIHLHHFLLRIDAFIRAFPNLTDLYIHPTHHGDNVDMFILEALHESHTVNVTQQRAGLTSHVQRITLDDMLDDDPRKEMLATVLQYARPLHLKLAMTSAMLGDADQGFIATLQDEGASNLINLNMHIYFGQNDREKDLSILIDNLIAVLTGLPLKFLELRFETSSLDATPRKATAIDRIRARRQGLPEPPAPTPTPLTPGELSLQNLDMDGLIDRLESMPSLEAAHVVILGSRDGDHDDWNGHERTITKGTSHLAGRDQWRIKFGSCPLTLIVASSHCPVCSAVRHPDDAPLDAETVTAFRDPIRLFTTLLCRNQDTQASGSSADAAGYATPLALGHAIRDWAGIHSYSISVYLHAMLRIAGGVEASIRERRVFLFFMVSQRTPEECTSQPIDGNPATAFILKEARLVREDFSSTYQRDENSPPDADFRPPGLPEDQDEAGAIPILWIVNGASFMVSTQYSVYPASHHPDDAPPGEAMAAVFKEMSQIFMTFMNYGIVLHPPADPRGLAPPDSGTLVQARKGWKWHRDRRAWRTVKELMPHHGVTPQTPFSPTDLWTHFWSW